MIELNQNTIIKVNLSFAKKHDMTAVLKPVCMFDGITMDGILDAILSDPT
jgi:hypothetical protein